MTICGMAGVPERLRALAHPPAPRRVRRGADGQQRPHPRRQRADAAASTRATDGSASRPSANSRFRDALCRRHAACRPACTGVYGKGPSFVAAFDGLDRFVTEAGRGDAPEVYRFPGRAPAGNARAHRLPAFVSRPRRIDPRLRRRRPRPRGAVATTSTTAPTGRRASTPTDLVLQPAACYPLYPMATGELPEGGRLFDVLGTCFRHEPSDDPARMQAFHMHEFVHLGTPESALAFRDDWLARSQQMMDDLGLQVVEPKSPTIRSSVGPARCSPRASASARSSSSCSRPCRAARTPDRDHLVQLPPRSLHACPFGISAAGGGTRTPRASASASSGSCSGCSRQHGLDTDRWPRETCGSDSGNDPSPPDRRGHATARARCTQTDRVWVETNCYVDLWIELLHALGLDCAPALAFTLSVDFEGDQWQFFKFPLEDLRTLYGLDVAEMNPWRGLEHHIEEQLDDGTVPHRRGRLLVPPRHGRRLVSPRAREDHDRAQHDRSRAAAARLLPQRRLLRARRRRLRGPLRPRQRSPEMLPAVRRAREARPTCERSTIASCWRPRSTLVRVHLARRPATNPVQRFRKRLEQDLDWLQRRRARDVSSVRLRHRAPVRQRRRAHRLALRVARRTR